MKLMKTRYYLLTVLALAVANRFLEGTANLIGTILFCIMLILTAWRMDKESIKKQ
jgi:uncharacterized membrane protein|nr:MAG TPA: hypothetical protein [Caudoviricetes sp.]